MSKLIFITDTYIYKYIYLLISAVLSTPSSHSRNILRGGKVQDAPRSPGTVTSLALALSKDRIGVLSITGQNDKSSGGQLQREHHVQFIIKFQPPVTVWGVKWSEKVQSSEYQGMHMSNLTSSAWCTHWKTFFYAFVVCWGHSGRGTEAGRMLHLHLRKHSPPTKFTWPHRGALSAAALSPQGATWFASIICMRNAPSGKCLDVTVELLQTMCEVSWLTYFLSVFCSVHDCAKHFTQFIALN